ncbi:hypothetical protein [Candidatus Binatus sp.]|uniref:hypothetical protein n=1 Tax=Candidatus Binatus sp. TaxID=2811406 RepID=UPI00272DA998|nr:hypothetical protein [Candidatus Binatus sp.]
MKEPKHVEKVGFPRRVRTREKDSLAQTNVCSREVPPITQCDMSESDSGFQDRLPICCSMLAVGTQFRERFGNGRQRETARFLGYTMKQGGDDKAALIAEMRMLAYG